MTLLKDIVINSAKTHPERLAVSAYDGTLSYSELDQRANQLARLLSACGVEPRDRVGLYSLKSYKTVVAMQAILRLGAIYVPINPLDPVGRGCSIIDDCNIFTLLTTADAQQKFLQQGYFDIHYFIFDDELPSADTETLGWRDLAHYSAEPFDSPVIRTNDLAYILYTSGSTGKPKGVCISNRNALEFICWAAKTLNVQPEDRISNHAGFHFDLSVFDLYVAFLTGASVHIIAEAIAYSPLQLKDFTVKNKISIWYSVPTAITMMMEGGDLMNEALPDLHTLVFAGEVFPMEKLRQLRAHYPDKRLFNFYGPTETNVCTCYEIKNIAPDASSIPIGNVCCGNQAWVETEDGNEAQIGEKGELIIKGPTVMHGYWGKVALNENTYRTGDLVEVLENHVYRYIGRKDYMLKVRGYRVEPEEVESSLLKYQPVEDAVAFVSNAKLMIALTYRETKPTLLDIKKYCADNMPHYMIPDRLVYLEKMPRTPNGKKDRVAIKQLQITNNK